MGLLAQYKLIQLNQSQYDSLSGKKYIKQANQARQRAITTPKAIALHDYRCCSMEYLAGYGNYILPINFMLK